MRLTRLRAPLALVLHGAAFAQAPIDLPVTGATPGVADMLPVHDAALAGGVTVSPDLTYATVPGFRPLVLDLYRPTAARSGGAGLPLVVYVHGGAWMGGTARNGGALSDFPAAMASLAARGYVVASLTYRLSGEARFPAPLEDVKAAMRWLAANAGTYGIDPARTVIWGGSAGGHLAALAATTCEAGAPCVRGAAIWYGVFDLATIAAQAKAAGVGGHDVPGSAEWKMLGCFADACPNGAIAAASPVAHVEPRMPPMLLIAGRRDRQVPFQQSVEMADRLKAAGVPAELILLDDIDHSFIGATPAATRTATLRAWEATVRFIDRTIGPAARQSGLRSD